MKNIPSFFYIVAILILLSPSVANSYHASTNISGMFHYYVIINSQNLDDPTDSFTVTGTITLKVENGEITGIIGEMENVKLSGSAFHIINLKNYLASVLKKWYSSIRFVSRQISGEKVYTSIDGRIVEAYLIRKALSVEYREKNTGVYLGGDKVLTINYVFGTGYSAITIKYRVIISSILILVQPESIIDSFSIVTPPSKTVLLFGGIIACLVLIGTIYTLINWDKYNLDIFS